VKNKSKTEPGFACDWVYKPIETAPREPRSGREKGSCRKGIAVISHATLSLSSPCSHSTTSTATPSTTATATPPFSPLVAVPTASSG